MFSVTNPASSACNISCRRLEEDKPLSVRSSRVNGSLHSRRSARGSLVCAALHCSRQQRFDSSFQMAAGPDVNPGLQKVLLERLLLCLCCRSPVCSHAWVTYRGEIKREKHPTSQKSPFFLAFLEIKGISPDVLPLFTKEVVLMCILKMCIKLVPSLKEEPY